MSARRERSGILEPQPAEPDLSSRRRRSRRASHLPSEDVELITADANHAAALVKVFGNPVRGQILMLLAQFGSFTVTDLAILSHRSLPLTSSNIAQLKRLGWIHVQASGREKMVRIASQHQRNIIDVLRNLSAIDLPKKGLVGE